MKDSSNSLISRNITLEPADNYRLKNLCGQFDEHIHQIEDRLSVEVANRGNVFRISGNLREVKNAERVIYSLFELTNHEVIDAEKVHMSLQEMPINDEKNILENQSIVIKTPRRMVKSRGYNQKSYLESIKNNDLTFGIGPAGTGKTYLAIACAIDALEKEKVSRIVLVRPAVEAGERLGFLPGDMSQKVDPYLRPMYDALYDMAGSEHIGRLIEKNFIEIAPLAFMRGRSLNDSFVILDEAQNTSVEQMQMFLTRIGFGSYAVVTGDVTQIDLPVEKMSGLKNAIDVLNLDI